MSIAPCYQKNFDTLIRAVRNGDVCVVECKDAVTGKLVNTVCAVNKTADDGIDMVPIAKLFDGNPYEELLPPTA